MQDEEDRPSPVLAPKLKDPKEEQADYSPAKAATGGSSRVTPASKSAKGKRKNGDDTKSSSAPQKKVKTENVNPCLSCPAFGLIFLTTASRFLLI